jgi:DNA-binding NarL/FixJ family response regulator
MKIVILDDHPLITQALSQEIQLLLPDSLIFTFHTISKCKEFIESELVDYLICDLHIVMEKSLEIPQICYKLKIPYMVFSSHTNKVLLEKLNKLEIYVYVSKASSPRDLKSGLLSLFNRQKFFCPIIHELHKKPGIEIATEPIVATKTQKIILSLLAQGMSQSQVADRLNIAERTLINHLSILRDINDCYSTTELLRRYNFWNS